MHACANLEIQHGGNVEIVRFDVVSNTIQCPMIKEASINVHHWETNDIKSNCFDCCELYMAFQIKDNLGDDAGIIPLFRDKNAMRDFTDASGLCATIVTVLKSKLPAKYLDMNRHLTQSPDSHETVNMSRFLQKLEHCNGEDSTKLHNHSKHSRLKIQGFGINLDSKQVVVVLVSSFIGKLGNWASNHSTEIYDLATIDGLIDYIRVSFSIEDVEGKN